MSADVEFMYLETLIIPFYINRQNASFVVLDLRLCHFGSPCSNFYGSINILKVSSQLNISLPTLKVPSWDTLEYSSLQIVRTNTANTVKQYMSFLKSTLIRDSRKNTQVLLQSADKTFMLWTHNITDSGSWKCCS